LIRENKAHQVYSIIQVSGKIGMKTMNQSLYEVYKAGHLTFEDACQYSSDVEDLKKTFQRG
jgi:twitching motility protein PilT